MFSAAEEPKKMDLFFSKLAYNGLILAAAWRDDDGVVNWCTMTEWAL